MKSYNTESYRNPELIKLYQDRAKLIRRVLKMIDNKYNKKIKELDAK